MVSIVLRPRQDLIHPGIVVIRIAIQGLRHVGGKMKGLILKPRHILYLFLGDVCIFFKVLLLHLFTHGYGILFHKIHILIGMIIYIVTIAPVTDYPHGLVFTHTVIVEKAVQYVSGITV